MASRALHVQKPTPIRIIQRRLESVPLNSPQCHDPLIDYPQVVPTHDLHPGEFLLDLTRVMSIRRDTT